MNEQLLVKQLISQSIVYGLVLIITSVIVFIATYKLFKRFWNSDNSTYIPISVILGFLTVGLIVLDFSVLPEYIMKVINPEFYINKSV